MNFLANPILAIIIVIAINIIIGAWSNFELKIRIQNFMLFQIFGINTKIHQILIKY